MVVFSVAYGQPLKNDSKLELLEEFVLNTIGRSGPLLYEQLPEPFEDFRLSPNARILFSVGEVPSLVNVFIEIPNTSEAINDFLSFYSASNYHLFDESNYYQLQDDGSWKIYEDISTIGDKGFNKISTLPNPLSLDSGDFCSYSSPVLKNHLFSFTTYVLSVDSSKRILNLGFGSRVYTSNVAYCQSVFSFLKNYVDSDR
ncbi:MAG: hypothetical protein KC422_02760 [Trueperaceae bacterium]|nr:hypothetical protein [Trueperaceae bacterium]